MDVLSDLCRSLRLSGEIYFRAAFAGDWAVELPASRQDVRFHLCLAGSCQVAVGRGSCTLTGGDLVLVPHGAAQILSSHADPARLGAARPESHTSSGGARS